jgi:hypothetical protein
MPDTTPAEPAAAPEEPKSLLDKLGAALPVGLTALATVFAGMSSGQLQQAMFWKSQAAQDQSKAANQWSLFGFKRSRALEMETAAARSRADSGYLRVQFEASGPQAEAARWLNGDGPPRTELPPPANADLVQLVKDIRDRKHEAELEALALKIPIDQINKAIDDAEEFIARTTDKDWDDVIKAAKKLAAKDVDAAARTKPDEPIDAAKKARADAVQAMVFSMEERRYRAEGYLNNSLGYLYEARVRYSTAESDRHRHKSEILFKAMLVAQIGAVASSLALARRRKSFLWLFAAIVGLVAIGFGAYAMLPGLPVLPLIG